MKKIHEIYEQEKREKEHLELKSIIDKPYLNPLEIWTISESNFYLWRRKHDYPRLLKYFNEHLKGFDDWKKAFEINDKFLISYGLSNCLKLNPNKNVTKYLIQSKRQNSLTKFVSFENLDRKSYRLGPYPVEHKLIKTFVGYLDWAKSKHIEIFPQRKIESIFQYTSKSNVHRPEIEVSILKDLKLLKIGGVIIKPDHWGLIIPKYFEFVNADFLVLEGNMATGGRQLVFDNSSVDNLICNNLDIALVKIYNSSLMELEVTDSQIHQWEFVDSMVSGKMTNSDFYNNSVLGGLFNVDFRDSKISNVYVKHSKKKELAFEKTYQTFKQICANQGDDKNAIEFFLLEKEISRHRLIKEILHPQIRMFFKTNWIWKFLTHVRHRMICLVKLIFSWINFLFWGYGRRPLRIILNSLVFILTFTILFCLNRDCLNASQPIIILDAFYISTTTFFTIGNNQLDPQGITKILIMLETILGGLSFGFLIGGLSNTKY